MDRRSEIKNVIAEKFLFMLGEPDIEEALEQGATDDELVLWHEEMLAEHQKTISGRKPC